MKQLLLIVLLFISGSLSAQQPFTAYFDFDIDEANDASGQTLSQWMMANKGARIQKIQGYTDKSGPHAYNLSLSERRARYVYRQLELAGFDLSQTEVKGFGEAYAAAPDNAPDRKAVIHYEIPAPVSVPKAPEPVVSEFSKAIANAKKGDKLRLSNMNFYNYSDIMLPASKPVLEELLAILKTRPTLKIDIQGHVCCKPEDKNRISHRRAAAVYNYLIAKGIDPARLSYKSFGNTRPIHPIPEKTEAQREANRRVEIEIIDI